MALRGDGFTLYDLRVTVEKGRKPMWAVFSFEEKAGVKPPHDWNNHALVPPSERVLNWIIHRNIRYAKGRQRQGANQVSR